MFVTYESLTVVEENGLVSIPVKLVVNSTGASLCSNEDLRTQRSVQVSYAVYGGDAIGEIIFTVWF